jgi:pyrophosphatase PpaX
MAQLTTVLFDLDGTLIDSVRLILDSYHHTLATHGLEARTDDFWLAGMGTPLRVQLKHWADDAMRLEALIATYREYNLTHHDGMVTAYPGVVAMVRAVRQAGYRTGLVTSKNKPGAERGLKLVGLDTEMELIIGADDVVNPKPHPEPIRTALERLGEPVEGAIYVGDSVHDMESGRAAGVATAAVLWGPFRREHLEPAEPDFWLEAPADLLGLLGIREPGAGGRDSGAGLTAPDPGSRFPEP